MEIETHIPLRSSVVIKLVDGSSPNAIVIGWDTIGVTAIVAASTTFYPWSSVLRVKLLELPAKIDQEVWAAS